MGQRARVHRRQQQDIRHADRRPSEYLVAGWIIAYDPMATAYAFSPFGYTGSFAGFGDTEAARANTAVEYRLDFMNFRGAGLVQWGGYDQGNATTGMYQGQIGADFANLFGGTLSLDGIRQLLQEHGRPQHLHRDLRRPQVRPFRRPNRLQ